MKNKRLLVLLGGLVLAGAAFLLLNFRLAVGSTQSNELVFTTDSAGQLPTPGQGNDSISLLLVGDGPVARALPKVLMEQMDEAGMGQIELVQELKPGDQSPVLVVKVLRPNPIWTPFFASSGLPVHAGYASNGDMTFMEAAETTHTNVASPDHSVLTMYAEYEVKDRSLGLISRGGYHQFLAEYLAQEIVTALQDLYRE